MIVKPIPEKFKKRKLDGLIRLDDGTVKACIEYKTPTDLNTQAKIKRAIEQEIDVVKYLCNLLIVSDGSQTFWVNPHTKHPIETSGDYPLPVFNAEAIVAGTTSDEYLQGIERIIDSADHFLSPTNDRLEDMLPTDPSQLAHTLWQKIWINTGKEPEKCLYNVVELLIFKFLSDLSVLARHENFATIHKISKEDGYDAALKIYANMSRVSIRNLFPAGGDGTTIINGTIFVNETGEAKLSAV